MTCRLCLNERPVESMYHGRCLPCRNATSRERYRANPAEHVARVIRSRNAKPERIEAHQKACRKYRAKRPSAILAAHARRRNGLVDAECKKHPYCSIVTAVIVIVVGDGICGICGLDIADDDTTWEIDHRIPIVSGLPGLNCLKNLQPAHRSCNRQASSKGYRRRNQK